jgi:transcriptional regulator with XRE-family HTH domain
MNLVLLFIRKNVLFLSQRDIGKKMGVTHTTYGNYELGDTKITLDFLEEYGKACDLNVEVLLDIYKVVRHNDKANKRGVLDQLTPEQHTKFFELLLQVKGYK